MAGDANSQQGEIIGYTKPKKFLFFKIKSKPIYKDNKAPAAPKPGAVPVAPATPAMPQQAAPRPIPTVTPQQPAQPTVQQPVEPVQKPAPQPSNIPQWQQRQAPKQDPNSGIHSQFSRQQAPTPMQRPAPQKPQAQRQQQTGKRTRYQIYVSNVIAKQKGLEALLRTQQISATPQEFVKKMMTNAIIVSVVVAVGIALLMNSLLSTQINNPLPVVIIVSVMAAIGCYQFAFKAFLNYPKARAKDEGKEAERGILFAARDIIISLRSGIPLFNAMTSVSTGYGAASKEFARIVSLIQLGTPMDQAIDEVSSSSTSRTFKRIMLQASVSIREGADVVQALEEVVEQVMQERVIELRRYGQRLNAISMFYMLFGVIFPSMGVAVLTILTTFISIFTVNTSFLILILVFIALLQFIFLNLMRGSRPVFSM